MNLIVAVDKNWGIGYKGDLLAKIPQDQKFFKEMTTRKAIIMGRKTLESLPGARPLPNRLNIIISNQSDYRVEGGMVACSIEEALELASDYKDEDIFVIGGESIYTQMLDQCQVAYVTKINKAYKADMYFPNLDKADNWQLVEELQDNVYKALQYRFCIYQRR